MEGGKKFQSLIGRLKTHIHPTYVTMDIAFQSLIGRLKTQSGAIEQDADVGFNPL